MAPRFPRIRPRAALSALLAVAVSLGCDRPAGPATAADGEPASAADATRSDPKRTTFAGDWWVFCTELPYQAFKLSLLAPDEGEDFWEGSWISFDWRGTSDPGALSRASAAVAVNAHRGADGTIVINGPVPQLDAQGLPTGDTGSWELAVQRTSLSGQPLRYSGSMRHSESPRTAAPLSVELETGFRPWTR